VGTPPATGKRPPTQHALLTKIVDLCSEPVAAQVFGMSFDFPYNNSRKHSVVKRLLSRRSELAVLRGLGEVEGRFRLMHEFLARSEGRFRLMDLPKGSDRGFLGFWPSSEVWENAHRLRPDLHMLPDAKTANRSEK
jgi:hypothetical protein